MNEGTRFGQVLVEVDRLSVEEQETLVEVIRRRLIDRRRQEIVREIKEAEREFERGNATPVSPDELMKEILS